MTTNNNIVYEGNKDDNKVNHINNDVYIDSDRIKQEQLLRAKHQKQKAKSLRQMRKQKEAQRTY